MLKFLTGKPENEAVRHDFAAITECLGERCILLYSRRPRSGLKRSGLKRSGLKHSGLKHSGLKHSGLKHSGLKHSGEASVGAVMAIIYFLAALFLGGLVLLFLPAILFVLLITTVTILTRLDDL